MGFIGYDLHQPDEPPFWENPHRLHEASVRLLGHFSSVQDLADNLVRRYVAREAPGLSYLVDKRVLSTMRDGDRVKAVHDVAAALGPTEHLAQVGVAFNRVKLLRDHLAHNLRAAVLLDAEGAFLQVVTNDAERAKKVGRLDAAVLGQGFLDCEWIKDQWLWTAQQTELFKILRVNGEHVDLVRPSLAPPLWRAGARPRPENMP